MASGDLGDIEITSVPEGSEDGSAAANQPGTALSTYVVQRTVPKASPLAPKERQPLFKTTLRKRWWLLGICFVVSAGVAAFVANRFQITTYEVVGKLKYNGLPEMSRSHAFSADSVETHAELLQSAGFLNTVIEKRKLGKELDVMGLLNQLDVAPDSKSRIITVILTTSELDKGVDLLNDMMEMYVQRAIEDRRNRATEHVRHAEEELFRAEANEENCRKLLRNFAEKIGPSEFEQQQIPDTLKQYATALNSAQIAVTDYQTQIKEIETTRKQQIHDLNTKALDAKISLIKGRLAKYDTSSEIYLQLKGVLDQCTALADKTATVDDFNKWKEVIDLPGKNLTSFPWLNSYGTKELDDLAAVIDRLSDESRHADMSLKARTSEVTELTAKIEETKKKLEAANNAMRPQSEERKAFQDDLAAATSYKQDVRQQLMALRQIKASPVKEFAIANKATWNGNAKSSFKKLFAAALFFVTLLLAAPVFGCEYYLNRDSPADETARRFGLPLLSRGALRTRLNRGKNGELMVARPDGEGEDSLRLLALRIQQSLRRPGAVILFSPLEHDESPISLICKLAVCFAEREELVLVVDAGNRLADSRGILASLFQGTAHRTPDGKPLDPTTTVGESEEPEVATFGVSDYLCQEELEIGDLVLHTKYSRVDCIHGGVGACPREGLASRRLSDLLEQSRGRYTMILVAGPSTKNQTDLQLLAARADGMLFTIAPNAPVSSKGHEVIQDLMDLGAPVMGLIG
jgi:Mrp family chromosome partitioning ATPase